MYLYVDVCVRVCVCSYHHIRKRHITLFFFFLNNPLPGASSYLSFFFFFSIDPLVHPLRLIFTLSKVFSQPILSRNSPVFSPKRRSVSPSTSGSEYLSPYFSPPIFPFLKNVPILFLFFPRHFCFFSPPRFVRSSNVSFFFEF